MEPKDDACASNRVGSRARITERRGDLVTGALDGGVCVVHCISSDAAVGRGVARALDDAFGIRETLRGLPENMRTVGNVVELRREVVTGSAKATTTIFNLITKARYSDLPTYGNMRLALSRLRALVDDYRAVGGGRRVDVLYMPLIGCGLDRLVWSRDEIDGDCVRRCVEDAFAGSDVELVILRLEDNHPQSSR